MVQLTPQEIKQICWICFLQYTNTYFLAKTPLDSHKPSTPDSHRGSLHLAERQEMTDQAEFVPEIHYTEKFLRIGNDKEI